MSTESSWLFDPTPYLPPAKAWNPRPHTLERVKSYFAGFAAFDLAIYPKRKTVAKKLGLSVRTLARYLRYLSDTGWMKTVCRKIRTAVRKLLKTEPAVPSAVPSYKTTSLSTSVLEVSSTASSFGMDSEPLQKPSDNALQVASGDTTYPIVGSGAHDQRSGLECESGPGLSQSVENVIPRSKTPWTFVKPPAQVLVNEYGRRDLNPLYGVWRAWFERLRPWLHKARNPEAYYRESIRRAGLLP